MKTSLGLLFALLVIPVVVNAQSQVSGQAGLASSFNLGESPNSAIYKGSFTWGERFRIEDSPIFNTADKLASHRGWYVANEIDALLFMGENIFVNTGFDYRYRNGGSWVKQVVYLKLGGGVEFDAKNGKNQIRAGFRKETFSINSLNKVNAAYFLYRDDKPIHAQNWFLRMEVEPGLMRYYEGPERRTGFYIDTYFGIAYKK